MKKLAGMLLCLIVLNAAPVMAQDTAPTAQNPPSAPAAAPAPAPAQVYNVRVPARIEISGGYSYRNYSPTPSTSTKTNGLYASVEYNVFSWLGAVAQAAGTGRRQGNQNIGTLENLGIMTVLAGVQAYPLHHRKLTPFGHALGGVGYYGLFTPAYGGYASKNVTSSGFAYEVGGGLDLRIKRHWSLRLAEGDYGSTSFFGGKPNQAEYRVSGGIVYLLGQK